MPFVLQDWVGELTMMQQSVLITATRAPDGIRKMHPVKVLCRWLRRCYLISAFDGCVLDDPYDERGGSFTGPCRTTEVKGIDHAAQLYIDSGDEIPLHFHFHLMQAAEILGYKHPNQAKRDWWFKFYKRLAAFGHLNHETESQMDRRLGDNKDAWLEREA